MGNLNQTEDSFCLASFLILFLSFSEKTSSLKSDYTTEPSWISVAKQRQKGFASHFPKKPRTRAEIRAGTKEQKYESKYDPDMESPRKVSGSTNGACTGSSARHAVTISYWEH